MIGVTGSNGFIGQRLFAALKSKGIPIDLRSQPDDEIRRRLDESGCSTIVHLASPRPTQEEIDQKLVQTETGALSEHLLELIEPLGKFHILFLSSIRVYPNNSAAITENSSLQPIDGYGQGKLASEKAFSTSSHKISCVRASSIQGIDHKGFARGVLGTFARQAKHEGFISVMGSGESKKDLLHVGDLVELALRLIQFPPIAEKNFLPVGGDNVSTVRKLAEMVADLTKVEINNLKPAKYDLSGWVDNTATKSLTGWSPVKSVEKMVIEAIDSVGCSS